MPETLTVPLQTVVPQSSNIRTLQFAWPLDFRPGQAIQVHFPGEEKKRFFSISSSPTEKGRVEITVKADPKGPLMGILDKLRPGSTLPVAGPFGSFTLPSEMDRPLCFIAAGSGITPFRSMIKFLIDEHQLPESWIFHSARAPEDFVFRSQFAQWEGAHRKLHYVPALTRDPQADWIYETGRITEKMLRKHIELEAHCFLLCGPPVFVADMEKMLQSLGIEAGQIRREQW
jgi:glycine betaine catabolism B